MRFEVTHLTRYAYDAPVRLGPHRLMLRPRDSHDLRLIEATLRVSPKAVIEWRHDVFGNSVGRAAFEGETATLDVESRLVLERYPPPPDETAPDRRRHPFAYEADDRVDLGALLTPERLEDAEAVKAWAQGAMGLDESANPPVPELLRRLTAAIHGAIRYEARETEGTQSARETLTRGAGTCRDLAQLMIEAARAFGFGARFVTGYLYSPGLDGAAGPETVGAAATHAWADVYDPDLGWVAFDPTNDAVESRDLIRVATVRAPRQAAPVAGSFTGDAQATMTVSVRVRALGPAG
ncbi:MAG: transglutaminase family protein [Rhodobacteraceae bacterium]|nr:MAG: transglutaminase family protein [Paracoccaceae bacterium]